MALRTTAAIASSRSTRSPCTVPLGAGVTCTTASGRSASCRARVMAACTASIGANVVGEIGRGRTRARNASTVVSIFSELVVM